MHKMKTHVLIVTAIIEGVAALLFLAVPEWSIRLVFGALTTTSLAAAAVRALGVALGILALLCWRTRSEDGSLAQFRLIAVCAIYNICASAGLLVFGLAISSTGIAMWPLILMHLFMAFWCASSIGWIKKSTR